MTDLPPRHVTEAAAVIESWVRDREQSQVRVSDAEFAKMSPRDRINYARGFDQSQFNLPEKRP
jgi:hypothetical protein